MLQKYGYFMHKNPGHQWTSHDHPDHTNVQFETLKRALKTLRSGQTITGMDVYSGIHGKNTEGNFSGFLDDCIVWCDFYSIPQASEVCPKDCAEEHAATSENMLKAINSLPAYVSRASLMLVLTPSIEHGNIPAEYCDHSSWSRRGWCRLEAMIARQITLCSGQKMRILKVMAPEKIILGFDAPARVTEQVGCGDFTCCTLNHKIDGHDIPCDKTKIAPVLWAVIQLRLQDILAKVATGETGIWEYRYVRAMEQHMFLGFDEFLSDPDYHDCCALSKVETWEEFRDLLMLPPTQDPWQKTDGSLEWYPLTFAVIANNVHVARFLLRRPKEIGANLNQLATIPHGHSLEAHYNYSLLHWVMKSGHGDKGKELFDLLYDNGADPYLLYPRRGTKKLWYDPFARATNSRNNHMLLHYMSRVKPKFDAIGDHFRDRNDTLAVLFQCSPEVIRECIKQGARFDKRNDFGAGTLQVYCITPKELQDTSNHEILNILFEANKITTKHVNDRQWQMHTPKWFVLSNLMYVGCRLGIITNPKYVTAYHLTGGTALHAAVYKDKAMLVDWLIRHGADISRKTRRGLTPLQMAMGDGKPRPKNKRATRYPEAPTSKTKSAPRYPRCVSVLVTALWGKLAQKLIKRNDIHKNMGHQLLRIHTVGRFLSKSHHFNL